MPTTVSELNALMPLVKENFNISYGEALSQKSNYLSIFSENVVADDETTLFPFSYNNLSIDEVSEGESVPFRNLQGKSVTIKLKWWKGGAAIREVSFQKALTQSIFMKEINSLATMGAMKPWERVVNALVNGNTDAYYTMYDGQQLFSNTHTVGPTGAAYDNLIATLPLSGPNLDTVKTGMRRIPYGPNGEFFPMDNATWYLIVPPALERTARQIINNDWIPEANFSSENPDKGSAQIISEDRLVDQDDWYLIATLPGSKPFVSLDLQGYTTPFMQAMFDPRDNNVLNLDEYRWALKMVHETFPTQFWLMTKVTN